MPSDDVIQNVSPLPLQNTAMFRPGVSSPCKRAVAKRYLMTNATSLELPKRRLFADQGVSLNVDEKVRDEVIVF